MKILPNFIGILREVAFIIIAILSFPSFLLFPFFFLPFYIYRTLVHLLSKMFNPKAVKMMPLRNSVVAHDDLHVRPEQSIVISIGFKGHLDLQLIYKMAVEQFEKRDENNKLVYPEFKQYYSSWGGYLFWMNDESFDLSNHLSQYDTNGRAVGYEELKEFCLELPRKPFVKGRSPWEVILVNNFQHETLPDEDLSVMIFRAHHGLADGFSILESFINLVGMWEKIKEKLPMPIYSSGAERGRLGHYLWMLLTAPYHSLKQGPGSYDINAFRIKEKKLTKKLRTAHLKYELGYIKENSRKWGVSFSGFVFAAICGGFRNFMLENKMKVPESFHVGMPFPWPGRNPTKVQNRMCVCVLKFPVGTAMREERVKETDKLWKELKNSPAPLMNWTFMPVFGLLPGFLIKMFIRNNFTTAVLSNFPGPPERLEIQGTATPCFTEDVEFITGLWRGNCGVGIGMLSVHGVLKINVGVDEGIFEQSKVDELKEHIEKEIKILTDRAASFKLEV